MCLYSEVVDSDHRSDWQELGWKRLGSPGEDSRCG